MPRTVFLLSPAHAGGQRARILLREGAGFELACRLRLEGVALGEAFEFMSGLYFRGKLAYARAFAPGPGAALVITPERGLLPADRRVTRDDLAAMATVEVSADEPRYRVPLERDARALAARLAPGDRVLLLGSIATGKYVDVLEPLFGPRLVFPAEFVGRGDMSRGALLLRAAEAGRELDYVPVAGTARHGPRALRLPARL